MWSGGRSISMKFRCFHINVIENRDQQKHQQCFQDFVSYNSAFQCTDKSLRQPFRNVALPDPDHDNM